MHILYTVYKQRDTFVNKILNYKENYAISDMTIMLFCESLMLSLLFFMPFEKLKFSLRQQSLSHSKRKLSDHKLEEKEGSARIIRRHC